MLSQSFYQRLKDLENHIASDQELLNDFEEELRYATNPRVIGSYRREIKRQQESLAKYEQELAEIKQELAGTPNAQMQNVESQLMQLQQMDAKLDVLLNGQEAIYENQNQIRQTLLNRYDASERDIIDIITQKFNETQLVLTQNLIDALEANLITEQEMQQMLAVLEKRIPSLPPSQASKLEIIKDPKLDAKHKLKLTLPIIPMFVEYEGELELGSGFWPDWEQLVAKLRRR